MKRRNVLVMAAIMLVAVGAMLALGTPVKAKELTTEAQLIQQVVTLFPQNVPGPWTPPRGRSSRRWK